MHAWLNRKERRNLMHNRSRVPLWFGAVAIYGFLYAPIAAIAIQSFNQSKHGGAWQGFTTQWYRALANNDLALHATLITLALAVLSTAVSTLLGTMLAVGLHRGRFPGRTSVEAVLRTIIVVPDIVMAIGLLMFFAVVRSRVNLIQPGLISMTLAHITFQIPFVTLVVRARLAGLDRSLAEAARDLGASGWQTFRHVTWPLIWPGVLAGALLAFTLSLDDFVISFFTTGPGATTLPILIYSSVKRGITPDIHALSTLMMAVSVLATTTVMLLQKRSHGPASRF
jgi:spermidine/putrescine transport system permease protein